MSPLDADDIFTSCSHYIIDSLCSAKLDFLRCFFFDRFLCPGGSFLITEVGLVRETVRIYLVPDCHGITCSLSM